MTLSRYTVKTQLFHERVCFLLAVISRHGDARRERKRDAAGGPQRSTPGQPRAQGITVLALGRALWAFIFPASDDLVVLGAPGAALHNLTMLDFIKVCLALLPPT
jgi:hypothetical protein